MAPQLKRPSLRRFLSSDLLTRLTIGLAPRSGGQSGLSGAALCGCLEEDEGSQMATRVEERQRAVGRGAGGGGVLMRLSSETKHSFKTTEFWAMVAVIVGILVASKVVGQGDGNGNGGDAFPAVRAWLYIAIVAVGYMVSRGLAKAGSRDPYWAGPDDLPGRDADR
jgi:hypothetical protein